MSGSGIACKEILPPALPVCSVRLIAIHCDIEANALPSGDNIAANRKTCLNDPHRGRVL